MRWDDQILLFQDLNNQIRLRWIAVAINYCKYIMIHNAYCTHYRSSLTMSNYPCHFP